MRKQVKKVVKKGRWIYGDTVQSEVWIIQQNYFEGPTMTDEAPTPGYPPQDENGMFYYAGYVQNGAIKGISNVCGSSDEAERLPERTIRTQNHLGVRAKAILNLTLSCLKVPTSPGITLLV
jgi:hypothetical protein